MEQIVVCEHTMETASVAATERGEEALAGHMNAHPEWNVIGWCHSHHTKLQRVASAADLKAQGSHQAHALNAFLMVIVWAKGIEESSGMSVQCIKPDRMSALEANGWCIDTGIDSEEQVEDYLMDVPWQLAGKPGSVEVVRLGSGLCE